MEKKWNIKSLNTNEVHKIILQIRKILTIKSKESFAAIWTDLEIISTK